MTRAHRAPRAAILAWALTLGCGEALVEAPPLEGVSLDGEALSAPRCEAITVIQFMGPHCSACRRATEFLLRERAALGGAAARLQIIGVFLGTEAEAHAARDKHDITFPLIVDRDRSLNARFGVRGLIPTLFVIDELGYLHRRTHTGNGKLKRLWSLTRWLLEQPHAPCPSNTRAS